MPGLGWGHVCLVRAASAVGGPPSPPCSRRRGEQVWRLSPLLQTWAQIGWALGATPPPQAWPDRSHQHRHLGLSPAPGLITPGVSNPSAPSLPPAPCSDVFMWRGNQGRWTATKRLAPGAVRQRKGTKPGTSSPSCPHPTPRDRNSSNTTRHVTPWLQPSQLLNLLCLETPETRGAPSRRLGAGPHPHPGGAESWGRRCPQGPAWHVERQTPPDEPRGASPGQGAGSLLPLPTWPLCTLQACCIPPAPEAQPAPPAPEKPGGNKKVA